MKEDLREHYAVGQTANYNNQPKNGTIVKVTKSSVKLKYNGYTVLYHHVKMPKFLDYLKIIPQ